MNAPAVNPRAGRLFALLRLADLYADRHGLPRRDARHVVAQGLHRGWSAARALAELRREVRDARLAR